MTTIAAVRKGKKVCIASDTLTTFGTRKEIAEKHVCKKGKIIKIGPNFIGTTGHASWGLILSNYFSNKKLSEWETEQEVFDTFNSMHQELKDKYYLLSANPQLHSLESSEFSLLMINRHGIFEIPHSRAVRKHAQFTAIGSGEEYALGALRAVYDSFEDAEEIAKIGIEVASHFDQKTGLPMEVYFISVETARIHV